MEDVNRQGGGVSSDTVEIVDDGRLLGSVKQKKTHHSRQQRDRMLFFGAALFLICALSVSIAVLALQKEKTVVMNDYLLVTSGGFEGQGTCSAAVDREKLKAALDGKLKFASTKEGKELKKTAAKSGREAMDLFLDGVYVDLSKTDDLSSGEKVTVSWSCQAYFVNGFNYKPQMKPYEYSVSPLDNYTEYDPFSDINVVFSGTDGHGICTIYTGNVKLFGLVFRQADTRTDLKNGDSVLVAMSTADGRKPADFCREKGYLIGDSLKEYKVEGLDAPKEMNPFEGLKVSFDGYNYVGRVNVDKSGVEDTNLYYRISQKDGLKNGDVITVTVDVPYGTPESYFEAKGRRAVSVSKDYTVSGLKDIELFDPFDGVEVTFTGVSPNVRASLSTEGSAFYKTGISDKVEGEFTISKSFNLSNDEVVKVRFVGKNRKDISEECAKYDMVPEAVEKEFTVSGMASYVQTPDGLKPIMDSLAALVDARNAELIAEDGYGEITASECLGTVLAVGKSGESFVSNNVLYLVYRLQMKDEYDEITVYRFYRLKDVAVSASGEEAIVDAEDCYVGIDTVRTYGDAPYKYHNYSGYQSPEDLRKVIDENLDSHYQIFDDIKE